MSFYGFIAHFFLVLSKSPFPRYTTVYLTIHLLKDILVASKFWQFWISCYKNQCAGFCIDTDFQLFGIEPRSMIAGSYGKNMFSFVRNFQTISLKKVLNMSYLSYAQNPAMNPFSFTVKVKSPGGYTRPYMIWPLHSLWHHHLHCPPGLFLLFLK